MAKARAAANAEREKIRAEAVKREQEILGAVRDVDRQDDRGRQARRAGRGRAGARRPEGREPATWRGTSPVAFSGARCSRDAPLVRAPGLAHRWRSAWRCGDGRGDRMVGLRVGPAQAGGRRLKRAPRQPPPSEPAQGRGREARGPAPFNVTEFGGETPPFIAMLINFGILAAGTTSSAESRWRPGSRPGATRSPRRSKKRRG